MGMTFREFQIIQSERLKTIYPEVEAREIVWRLFEHYEGVSRSKMLLMLDDSISIQIQNKLEEAIVRLLTFEPLQYVLGETEFYGYTFKVNSSVLIPRPETEELVDMVVKEWKNKAPSILDIGTGSGCIPIVLKKEIKKSRVTSIDISSDALAVARENAKNNKAEVEYILADMRTYTSLYKYDIIISNPPYVMESEKNQIRDNVLKFEPSLALFVADGDPLEFYKSIAKISKHSLNLGGRIYLEINQQLGQETMSIFEEFGFNSFVLKDLFGVDRFVIAEWM